MLLNHFFLFFAVHHRKWCQWWEKSLSGWVLPLNDNKGGMPFAPGQRWTYFFVVEILMYFLFPHFKLHSSFQKSTCLNLLKVYFASGATATNCSLTLWHNVSSWPAGPHPVICQNGNEWSSVSFMLIRSLSNILTWLSLLLLSFLPKKNRSTGKNEWCTVLCTPNIFTIYIQQDWMGQ